jgi:hypothetical protein
MATQTLNRDAYESTIRQADRLATEKTGMGLLHWLTLGSIATSIGLYISGRKELAIFIGLWPPTFMALKSAAETTKQSGE